MVCKTLFVKVINFVHFIVQELSLFDNLYLLSIFLSIFYYFCEFKHFYESLLTF